MSTLDLPSSARLLASLFSIEQAAQCGVCFSRFSRLPHFARRRCSNCPDWGGPAGDAFKWPNTGGSPRNSSRLLTAFQEESQ
jgi:hypothetical protein